MKKLSRTKTLFCGISIIALSTSLAAYAQELGEDGFAIVVDGEQIAGPAEFDEVQYSTIDPVINQVSTPYVEPVELTIRNDGFDVDPALDFQISQLNGELVVSTYANYPAFITRGEVIAYGTVNGKKQKIGSANLAPNSKAAAQLPSGDDITYAYRVYDSLGRFDQTVEKSADQEAYPIEVGANSIERQTIPVFGSAVRVNADNATAGARVSVLGETVDVTDSGSVAIERIVPPGNYDIKADYQSANGRKTVIENVNIPNSDWFYMAIADATYGQYLEDSADHEAGDSFNSGRLAFFARGKTESGYVITASADTGEQEIEDLFEGIDQKDPNSILSRVDSNSFFPVYGDQSVTEEFAPTSGKLYLRVERGDDYFMWGDFKANLEGADYVRSDRLLYGARAHYSPDIYHSNGESIANVDVFVATPDRLAQRDVLLGTGGSVYFLKEQDITPGSQTLYLEYRDPDTGRIIERRELSAGVDYHLNPTQGVVTLSSPLSSNGGDDGYGDDSEARLVAEYEYTPLDVTADMLSAGGRAEVSPIEAVTLGVSGVREEQGTNTQTLVGADVKVRIGENSEVRAEIARSEGPGFGYSITEDGGMRVDDVVSTANNRSADAVKVEGHVAFNDLQVDAPGYVDFYYEQRDAGFSSLDYNVSEDETLYGARVETEVAGALIAAYAEHYENSADTVQDEIGVEAKMKVAENTTILARVEHKNEETATDEGSITEAFLRVEQKINEATSVYGYGKYAIAVDGNQIEDNRFGVGASYDIDQNWNVTGEVSSGSSGLGAEILAKYKDERGNQTYFGYRLEPDRQMGSVALDGVDQGQFIIGSRNQINDSTSTFSEVRYDLFGEHQSLFQAYGIDYKLNEQWNFAGAVERGQITDSNNGDYDRTAVSLGANFAQKDKMSLDARIEYRMDEGVNNGQVIDQQTTLGTLNMRYTPTEEHTYFATAKGMISWNSPLSELNGTYVDANIGYAYRPIDNDRLNALVQYRYMRDELGQVLNGDISSQYDGMHIVAADVRYDIDGRWDIGGRVAYRDAFTMDDSGDTVHNRALLVSPSVRYKISHEWDVTANYRLMDYIDADLTRTAGTLAVYRHIGDNLQVGVGYNMGSFTDDLTDLDDNSSAVFFNIVADF